MLGQTCINGNTQNLTHTCNYCFVTMVTCAPLPQVEMLVMKALSLGLVKGSIDEVDCKVHMTWVQPRVLDISQVKYLQHCRHSTDETKFDMI